METPRAIPNLVGLIWDSSGSDAARDHGREFALLDAYFKKMGNGEAPLTRVRDIAEPPKRFAIIYGNWRVYLCRKVRRFFERTMGAQQYAAFR